VSSDQHPLDLIEGDLVMAAIVELGCSRRGMISHCGSSLQRATILRICRDPGRSERVIADRRPDLGRDRAPAYHRKGIDLGQGGIA